MEKRIIFSKKSNLELELVFKAGGQNNGYRKKYEIYCMNEHFRNNINKTSTKNRERICEKSGYESISKKYRNIVKIVTT